MRDRVKPGVKKDTDIEAIKTGLSDNDKVLAHAKRIEEERLKEEKKEALRAQIETIRGVGSPIKRRLVNTVSSFLNEVTVPPRMKPEMISMHVQATEGDKGKTEEKSMDQKEGDKESTPKRIVRFV